MESRGTVNESSHYDVLIDVFDDLMWMRGPEGNVHVHWTPGTSAWICRTVQRNLGRPWSSCSAAAWRHPSSTSWRKYLKGTHTHTPSLLHWTCTNSGTLFAKLGQWMSRTRSHRKRECAAWSDALCYAVLHLRFQLSGKFFLWKPEDTWWPQFSLFVWVHVSRLLTV